MAQTLRNKNKKVCIYVALFIMLMITTFMVCINSISPSPEISLRVCGNSSYRNFFIRFLSNTKTKSLELKETISIENSTRSENYVIVDWGPAYWAKHNNLKETDQVNNCIVTRDRSMVEQAHAVLIDIREVRGHSDIPKCRTPSQLWVYMNVESPYYAILEHRGKISLNYFRGDRAFNWTMTYRQDSDVMIWYGRKVPLKSKDQISNEDLQETFQNKKNFVIGSASNCQLIPSNRDKWFHELTQLDNGVHIYGACGNKGKCPGYLDQPGCNKIIDYKFFLAFENSACRDYITEKFWWNGFHYTAIPIVLGARREDIEKVAPENSFIHVDDFDTPAELLVYLHKVANDEKLYMSYLQWRHKYSIELVFRQFYGNPVFGWELLCDALNRKYGKVPSKTYSNLEDWISVKTDCYQSKWIANQKS